MINGNGIISVSHPGLDIEDLDIQLCSNVDHGEFNCPEGSHVFSMMHGKNASFEFTFVAEPDEGYQVKQWLFNSEIVQGNTTNSFLAKVSNETSYRGFIAVEFEPIA